MKIKLNFAVRSPNINHEIASARIFDKVSDQTDLESDPNIFFIEGGGTKGIYAIGVIKYLFESNPYFDISKIHTVGGTSAGALIATALSLSYDKSEIENMADSIDFSTVIDPYWKLPLTVVRFLFTNNLYGDKSRQNIIKNIIKLKIKQIQEDLVDPTITVKNLTFGNLRELVSKYPTKYKNLIINAADISIGQQVFFTTTEPKNNHIKILDALLATSAIPFVFKSTNLYRYDDGTYGYHKTDDSSLNILVDGGLASNDPFDYILLNVEKYTKNKFWFLRFDDNSGYRQVSGLISKIKTVVAFILNTNTDIKLGIVEEQLGVNVINLGLSAGPFDLYSKYETKKIIGDIYSECTKQQIKFI